MNDLDSIRAELSDLFRNVCFRKSLEEVVRIGNLLLLAKNQIPHGKFMGWIRSNGWKVRTCDDYLQVALAVEEDPSLLDKRGVTLTDVRLAIRRGRKLKRLQDGSRAEKESAACEHPNMILGNSLAWLRKQPDESIPFFVTDPPYGVGVTYGNWTEANEAEEHWRYLRPFWEEMKRCLVPGGIAYVWQAYPYLPHLFSWFQGCSLLVNCYKKNGSHAFDPIVKWVKPGAPPLVWRGSFNDWLISPSTHTPNTSHPCPKPLGMALNVIRSLTETGSLVVDPFAGIGTIPLACLIEGRRFVGIEREEPYYRLACRRLRKAKAKRVVTTAVRV
jgi:site-specific DNA-methyltransferase (adenine-specific)